jgi:hypothetical protein
LLRLIIYSLIIGNRVILNYFISRIACTRQTSSYLLRIAIVIKLRLLINLISAVLPLSSSLSTFELRSLLFFVINNQQIDLVLLLINLILRLAI